MINDEEFKGLSPVNFFQLKGDCFYTKERAVPEKKRYRLPPTDALSAEEPFTDLYIGWNEEGIAFHAAVRKPFYRSLYPEIRRGDSIELFIDTRDIKSAGFNTRFCHHFFFLPETAEGRRAGEITRFRGEESRPHGDPDLLEFKTKMGKNGYAMKIFIPSQSLHGYDSEQFNRLGFTYRINRPDGPSQHFSTVSEEYRIEQQPSLWSSLHLKR